MQNVVQKSEEKENTNINANETGRITYSFATSAGLNEKSRESKTSPRQDFMPDMSGSDEEDISEVESFELDQEDLEEHRDRILEASKFLLPAESAEGAADLRSVDPETHARLEALLEAAGIGKLSTPDGKALTDPEVLRKLTSSVSCALDEAAAALTRMRAEQQGQLAVPDSSRSLAEACCDGDVGTVKKMLSEGGSVHETTEEGESLLSLACSAGYYELAQVLLAMKASVEDRGIKGDCTPLMEAASSGFVEIVKLLHTHGADVNAQSSAGNTPLHYAAAGGYDDVVSVLITAGASVEEHNENGHTPLMEAASAGHVSVATILLDNGAGINTHSNEFKESALTLACYKGHLEMVEFLLEAGADQEHKTDEMHTALMEASMDGHVEVARLLLDSGAHVNMPADSFESPLTLAACGGHVHLANLLLERGANLEEVNDEGYTPLMEAAREGHEEMVTLLLAHGADINAQTEETQETALTLACCGGFQDVAEFLNMAGADIELGCSTPLMEASQEGHIDLVRYLLKEGANVHAQTGTGDTALTYACENGHTEVSEVLLEWGAELEHESEGGRTPLMKAARAGHYSTVEFLISKGADVNRQTTTNDHTVLSLASAGGHLSVVELLLAHGGSPTHRLKDGSTMIIEASKGGHTQVVNLLLEWPTRFLMSPIMEPEQDFSELRVPFPGLANYVPPSDPDSTLSAAALSTQVPATHLRNTVPNEVINPARSLDQIIKPGQKSVSKKANNNNNTSNSHSAEIHKMNNTNSGVKPGTENFTNRSGTNVAGSPGDKLPGSILENDSMVAGLQDLLPDDGGDFKANERLDAILSTMVKDHLLNTTGTPEEQLQRQQILEELQKVERELQEKTQAQLISQKQLQALQAQYQQQQQQQFNFQLQQQSQQALQQQQQQQQQQQHMIQLQNTPRPLHKVLQKQLEDMTRGHTPSSATTVATTSSNNELTYVDQASEILHAPEPQQLVIKSNPITVSGHVQSANDSGSVIIIDGDISGQQLQLSPTQVILQENERVAPLYDHDLDIITTNSMESLINTLNTNLVLDPSLSLPYSSEAPPLSPPTTELLFTTTTLTTLMTQTETDSQSVICDLAGLQQIELIPASTKYRKNESVKSNGGKLSTSQVSNNNNITDDVLQPSADGVLALCEDQLPDTDSVQEPLAIYNGNGQSQSTSGSQLAVNSQHTHQSIMTALTKQLQQVQMAQQPTTIQRAQQQTSSVCVTTGQLIIGPQPLSSTVGSVTAAATTCSTTAAQTQVITPQQREQLLQQLIVHQQQQQRQQTQQSQQQQQQIQIQPQASTQLLQQAQVPPQNLVAVSVAQQFAQALQLTPQQLQQLQSLQQQTQQQVQLHQQLQLQQQQIQQAQVAGQATPQQMLQQQQHTQQILLQQLHQLKQQQQQAQAHLNNLQEKNKCRQQQLTAAEAVVTQTMSSVGGTGTAVATSAAAAAVAQQQLHHMQLPNQMLQPQPLAAQNIGLPNGGLDVETGTPPPSTPLTPNPSPASPQTPLHPSLDLDAQTESNHDTALTLACAGGHAELVGLLQTKGSNIEHRDKKGFTPLILAATAGHVDVVEILLEHHAEIEAQSERTKDTPLSLACSGGRCEVVELLLDRGANKEHRNVSDYTPLSLAASGGYVNIIKLLLSRGAEINSRTGSKLGISPLMLAAMNGHTSAVKLLLDMGSDINAQIETNRNTALTLACFQGRHEVVSLLVDRKANIEHRAKTGLTPLMEAASGGYVEVGRVLLDKGADVNAPPVPSSRDTALTIAADKGHYRFVELLLTRGAAVDVKNKKGNSPLWLACNGGHIDVVQLLVSAQADIDSQDNRKVSCLMAAFRKGHVKVVKWMVKVVNQFPSDQECSRFIQTITDKELQKKCEQCMGIIESAKDHQAAEANKYATILLEELDMEKRNEENKRAAADRRREKRKKKRKEKQERDKGRKEKEPGKNSSPEPDDDGDGDDQGSSGAKRDSKDLDQDDDDDEDKDDIKIIEEVLPPLDPPSATTTSTIGTTLTSTRVTTSRNMEMCKNLRNKVKAKSDTLVIAAKSVSQPSVTSSLSQVSISSVASAVITNETVSSHSAPGTPKTAKRKTRGKERERNRERPPPVSTSNISSNASSTTKVLEFSAGFPSPTLKTSSPAAIISTTVVTQATITSTSKTNPLNSVNANINLSHTYPHHAVSSLSGVANIRNKKNDMAYKAFMSSTGICELDDFGTPPDAMKFPGQEVQQKNRANLDKSKLNVMDNIDMFTLPVTGKSHKPSAHSSSHNTTSSKTSGPPSVVESHPTIVALKSPGQSNSPKRGHKKDEGWKEVVRKSKRVTVPATAISRVIGRGGCNINAIREVSGAHIEVEKQKGTSDRVVTIKGSADSTRQAHALISALVSDPDKELNEIIAKIKAKFAEQNSDTSPVNTNCNAPNIHPVGSTNPNTSSSNNSSGGGSKNPGKSSTAKALQFTNVTSSSSQPVSPAAGSLTGTHVWGTPSSQGVSSSPKKTLLRPNSTPSQGFGLPPSPGIGTERGIFVAPKNMSSSAGDNRKVNIASGGFGLPNSGPATNVGGQAGGAGSGNKSMMNLPPRLENKSNSSKQQMPRSPLPGTVKLLQRPSSTNSVLSNSLSSPGKSEPQPLPIVASQNSPGIMGPGISPPGEFSIFQNPLSDVGEQVLGKKDDFIHEKCMNFASVAAAGVITPNTGGSNTNLSGQSGNSSHGMMGHQPMVNDLEHDLALQAKAPGFKPGQQRGMSPTILMSDGMHRAPGYKGPLHIGAGMGAGGVPGMVPMQNDLDFYRVPKYRGNGGGSVSGTPSSGMSPRSNSSTPSRTSPKSQQQLQQQHQQQQQLMQQQHHQQMADMPLSFSAAYSSAIDPGQLELLMQSGMLPQKDEYSMPNQPMTLPKIESMLNPNAPDFTVRSMPPFMPHRGAMPMQSQQFASAANAMSVTNSNQAPGGPVTHPGGNMNSVDGIGAVSGDDDFQGNKQQQQQSFASLANNLPSNMNANLQQLYQQSLKAGFLNGPLMNASGMIPSAANLNMLGGGGSTGSTSPSDRGPNNAMFFNLLQQQLTRQQQQPQNQASAGVVGVGNIGGINITGLQNLAAAAVGTPRTVNQGTFSPLQSQANIGGSPGSGPNGVQNPALAGLARFEGDLARNIGQQQPSPATMEQLKATFDERKMPRPIGTERAQRRVPQMGMPGGNVAGELTGIWALTSEMNPDWLANVAVTAVAAMTTSPAMTSSVMTSVIMTPGIVTQSDDQGHIHPVIGLIDKTGVKATLEQSFQNPPLMIPAALFPTNMGNGGIPGPTSGPPGAPQFVGPPPTGYTSPGMGTADNLQAAAWNAQHIKGTLQDTMPPPDKMNWTSWNQSQNM